MQLQRTKFSSEGSLAMRAFPTLSSNPTGDVIATRGITRFTAKAAASPGALTPPGLIQDEEQHPFPPQVRNLAFLTGKGLFVGASERPLPGVWEPVALQSPAHARRAVPRRGAGEGAVPPWRAGRCRRCPGNGAALRGSSGGGGERRERRPGPAGDRSPAAAASYGLGLHQPGLH